MAVIKGGSEAAEIEPMSNKLVRKKGGEVARETKGERTTTISSSFREKVVEKTKLYANREREKVTPSL